MSAPKTYQYQVLNNYLLMVRSLYRSPNIVRRLRWTGHVARIEEGRSTLNIFTGAPTIKIALGRPGRRWD